MESQTSKIKENEANDENDLEIINKNIFDITLDNKKYQLELKMSETNISVKISENDNILLNYYYLLSLNLSGFYEFKLIVENCF